MEKATKLWRLIITPPLNGYLNMAVDELLFEEAKEIRRPPTLRLYRWDGDWVSFGYFQTPQKALNVDEAEKMGVRYVRRRTGGRAVVHSEDLTYALVAGDAQHQGLGSSIRETYRQIARALTSGFTRLGLPVALSSSVSNGLGRARADGPVPCFLTLSDHEISAGGKKLVGSAQLRWGEAFLQHGSIPLTIYNRELAERVLSGKKANGSFDADRPSDFSARYAVLDEAANEKVPVQRLTAALREGFEEAFGVEFEPEEFSDRQMGAVENLAQKYASKAWNEGKRVVGANS